MSTKHYNHLTGLTIALLLSASPVAAYPTACPDHFLGGEAPDIADRQNAQAEELCFQAFAVGYSDTMREPLYSAEKLTADAVRAARGEERVDDFHPDTRLKPADRAELGDFKRSGFDRGHMVPDADVAGEDARDETFSLVNIVPQDPDNNRHLWLRIETAVRHLAERDGMLFVVSGPIYSDTATPRWLHDRVRIPDALFKAVYDPVSGAAAAYITLNSPGGDYRIVSIDELAKLTGVDVFPHLDADTKATLSVLPLPRR